MKRLLCIAVLMPIGGFWAPFAAVGLDSAGTADIIVLLEGSGDALAARIEALGGIIKFRYRNVPALAATIPRDKLGEVRNLPGVIKTEQDRLIRLAGEPLASLGPGRDMSFAVQHMAGVEVRAVDATAVSQGTVPEGYANHVHTGAFAAWGDTYTAQAAWWRWWIPAPSQTRVSGTMSSVLPAFLMATMPPMMASPPL